MSAKHEVHTSSNARILKVFLSCHGTKVSMSFVCHQQQTYEGMSMLPWIQGFHSYRLHRLLLLPQWTTPPNLKFIYLQAAMLQQYASVAMVTRFRSNSYHHGSFLLQG